MSLDNIDKTQIARSFGRAAKSYDSVAHFQRWVADSLFQKLPQGTYDSILDLGCGTAYSSDKLQSLSPTECYTGLDLSTDMLAYASTLHTSRDKKWVTGDAESLPLRGGT